MRVKVAQRQQLSNRQQGFILGLGLALTLAPNSVASAQLPPMPTVEALQQPALDHESFSALFSSDPLDFTPVSQTPRLRIFRMLPGFLSDPPSLSILDDGADYGPPPGGDSGSNWMTVNFGNDNPYFEPRQSRDPGGVGFYQIHSQVQVVDTGNTSVCLGLRAWTPAGLESGGVQNGQTRLAPGLGVFQDLGSGTAVQGFVDQTIRAPSCQGPVRCGMAWNCPLAPLDSAADAGMFFFVQALGRFDYGTDRIGRPFSGELLPGVHWRMTDAFGMSLGASRTSLLTCWWHF